MVLVMAMVMMVMVMVVVMVFVSDNVGDCCCAGIVDEGACGDEITLTPTNPNPNSDSGTPYVVPGWDMVIVLGDGDCVSDCAGVGDGGGDG